MNQREKKNACLKFLKKYFNSTIIKYTESQSIIYIMNYL